MPRAEMVLPVTIVLAAVVLGISEFMTTFEFTPPGGEPLDVRTAADQHSYALLMLAVFAVGSTLLAVGTGLRAFAFAAAGFGVAALLLFLIIDLPDAGKLGTLGGDTEFTFSTAKAEPKSGFVLEAVGSVVLGLATLAFATLRSSQLQAPLELLGSRRKSQGDKTEPESTHPRKRERPAPKRGRSERSERSTTGPGRNPGPSTSSASSSSQRPGWLSRRRGTGR